MITNAPDREQALHELGRMAHLLFGPRWQSEVARTLGLADARTVRRWVAGEGGPSERDLAVLRRIARARIVELKAALAGDPEPSLVSLLLADRG